MNKKDVIKLKRIVALICCFCCIAFSVWITPYAAQAPQNRIYAEKTSAEADREVRIPIRISGNTGLMGFAMSVQYDPDVFTPLSVEAGEMLTGLFNDSIGTSQSGSFDVFFTNSADITEDGVLFTIVLQTAAETYGSKTLTITYSSEDTFNENWDPVELSPEPITIVFPDAPNPPVEPEKLSVRISNWVAQRTPPFNKILKVLLTPLIWLICLFE